MPRSKPTPAQRHYMNGYEPNSVMARLSAEERRELKEKMRKAAQDDSAFERTVRVAAKEWMG